jgi:hypothetical protein
MSEPSQSGPQPLGYESPRAARASPVRGSIWGGIALLGAGLGLIVLGGCFLVGVLEVTNSPAATNYGPMMTNWPAALALMPWVLYLLAFGCFAGAVWMLAAGVRWLYSVG